MAQDHEGSRTKKLDVKDLNGCIRFWESKLQHDRFILESSAEVLVRNTVTFLKELKKLKSVNQKSGN